MGLALGSIATIFEPSTTMRVSCSSWPLPSRTVLAAMTIRWLSLDIGGEGCCASDHATGALTKQRTIIAKRMHGRINPATVRKPMYQCSDPTSARPVLRAIKACTASGLDPGIYSAVRKRQTLERIAHYDFPPSRQKQWPDGSHPALRGAGAELGSGVGPER